MNPDFIPTFAEAQRQLRESMNRDTDPRWSRLPVVGMEREGWGDRFLKWISSLLR